MSENKRILTLHSLCPEFKDDITRGDYKKYSSQHPTHLDEILISLVQYRNLGAKSFKNILKKFIKLGLDINKEGNYRLFCKYPTSLLNRLCELRKYFLIKICVAFGASVEGTDPINSILSSDIKFDRETLKSIKFLLERGAPVLLDEESVDNIYDNLGNKYGKEIDTILSNSVYDDYICSDPDYSI